MKKIQLFFTILFVFSFISIYGQNDLLQSGPMLGYSTMREVLIWVQTKKEADVKVVYWHIYDKKKKHETSSVHTNKEDAFTAKLIADEVEPGNTYEYEVVINGKVVERPYPLRFKTQKLWQWREDPPNFSFATGSGAFINQKQYDRPGKPYGGDYEIFLSINDKQPDFMLWLGDNFYLREVDWNSRTGILKRFTHGRSLAELQPLLGSTHHYAIWDDHDFGPNNSDRGFWNKETTLEAFKLFWGNPSYGINGKPGTTTMFTWGDVDFFLLDNRYYRSPDRRKFGKRQILGDEQIEWLIDNLATSHAPFKIIAIGGQVLNPTPTEENYSGYPVEKTKLLKLIEQEGINGVIFLTGDVHRTEISKLERRGTYPLYDFTISPFTSGPTSFKNAPNRLRIDGTLVEKRNFAIFEVTGPRKNRNLTCTVYDKDGNKIFSYTLNENELRD